MSKVFNYEFIKAQTNKITAICDDSLKYHEEISQKNKNNGFTLCLQNLAASISSNTIIESFIGGEVRRL